MATSVTLPALGESVTEGTVVLIELCNSGEWYFSVKLLVYSLNQEIVEYWWFRVGNNLCLQVEFEKVEAKGIGGKSERAVEDAQVA